jgi:hypothetical protein
MCGGDGCGVEGGGDDGGVGDGSDGDGAELLVELDSDSDSTGEGLEVGVGTVPICAADISPKKSSSNTDSGGAPVPDTEHATSCEKANGVGDGGGWMAVFELKGMEGQTYTGTRRCYDGTTGYKRATRSAFQLLHAMIRLLQTSASFEANERSFLTSASTRASAIRAWAFSLSEGGQHIVPLGRVV